MTYNRTTLRTIRKIRSKITAKGYKLEVAIVPLQNQYSVLAVKDDKTYNLRLNKQTLEIESACELIYKLNSRKQIIKIIRVVQKV